MNLEAAEHNWNILQRHGGNLVATLAAYPNSPLGYGSEFQPPAILAPLLNRHPLWDRMNNELTNGSEWDLEPISEEDRIADLQEALDRGNHKSAVTQPEVLEELVLDDVN